QDVRRHWGKDEAAAVDWDAVERRLFARIETEQRAERWSLKSLAPPRDVKWLWAAAALASAASIVAVVGLTRQPYSLESQHPTVPEEAASLVAIDGDGEVLVDGRPAAIGAVLRLGDVVEARGAQVTVSRPGKLTFSIERGSSVKVVHAQGTLVLALSTVAS